MSDVEYFLNDGESSGEDVEAGFEDGTSAIREFGRVVEDDSKSTGKGRAKLRLRKEPGLPSSVRNIGVVDSNDYFKHQSHDVLSTDDEDAGRGTDDELDLDENERGGASSESEDVDEDEGSSGMSSEGESEEEEDEDGVTLSLSNPSLLEAQWKLEEESKKELQLIQKRDEKERQQLKIKSQHSKNLASLWNSLVGIRIHLQKVLTATNRLPPPPAAQLFKEELSNGDDSVVRDQCAKSVTRLLISLRRLQTSLVRNNRQVSKAILSQLPDPQDDPSSYDPNDSSVPLIESRKRRRREFERSSLIHQESQAWTAIDRTPKRITRWAFNVADQWSSKTSLKVQQTFKVLDQSPSAQVARALRVDFERLLDKTRPTISHASTSGESRVLGVDLLNLPKANNNGPLVNTENYDDTELYVSLLKDTVQQNRNDTEMFNAASQVGALSARLKKQEAEKKKKEFDHKASNGRKIRYVPIPQLLSFMTAEPVKYGISPQSGMDGENDERLVNQLIASLFQDVEL